MIQPISGNIGCGNQFSFTTYCSTPLANLSNAFCRCWTCTCCFPTFHENMCKLWFQFWWEASSSEVLIRMRWVRQEAAQIHMAVCSLGWDSVAPLAVIQVNRISDGYSGGSLRHLPLANHCPQTVARNCCSVHVNRVRPVPTSACSDAQYMIRAVQSSFIAGNCAQAIPAPSHCIHTLTASSSGMFWYLKFCVKTRHIIHIHYRKMAPHSAESTNRPPLGRFGKQWETQARPQV